MLNTTTTTTKAVDSNVKVSLPTIKIDFNSGSDLCGLVLLQENNSQSASKFSFSATTNPKMNKNNRVTKELNRFLDKIEKVVYGEQILGKIYSNDVKRSCGDTSELSTENQNRVDEYVAGELPWGQVWSKLPNGKNSRIVTETLDDDGNVKKQYIRILFGNEVDGCIVKSKLQWIDSKVELTSDEKAEVALCQTAKKPAKNNVVGDLQVKEVIVRGYSAGAFNHMNFKGLQCSKKV